MTVPTTARHPRVPGYELAPPTEADARAMVIRVFGAERGATTWADACRAAGLADGGIDSPARLQRVATALTAQGKAAASIARSIEIRLGTHARLAARADLPTGAVR